MRIFALVAVLLLTEGFPVHAEIYKWTDENGNIHFGDRPPNKAKAKAIKSVAPPPANEAPPNAEPPALAPVEEPQPKISDFLNGGKGKKTSDKGPLPRNATVDLYTTSWCGYCKKAREFFNSNNIYFTEYDIEKDERALKRKLELGTGKSVPTAVINGQVIQGFSAKRYEAALRGE